MSERADLTHEFLIDQDGAMWCGDECPAIGPHHDGEAPEGDRRLWRVVGTTPYESLTDAEALTVLLPDVDWEWMRRMLDAWPNPEALTPLQRMAHDDFLRHLARRLLAVYDGKDG